MSLQPVFSRISQDQKEQYDHFFEYTSPEKIQNYAQGWSLTDLVSLASKTISVIERTNPIWDTWEGGDTDQVTTTRARRWQLDRISEVKERLANAIPLKKSYYDNHWFGVITKYVLWCFGMWNDGTTHSIKTAEDFLLRLDSRACLIYSYRDQCYQTVWFQPMPYMFAESIRNSLDTSRFYNYTPDRTIRIQSRDLIRNVPLPCQWINA